MSRRSSIDNATAGRQPDQVEFWKEMLAHPIFISAYLKIPNLVRAEVTRLNFLSEKHLFFKQNEPSNVGSYHHSDELFESDLSVNSWNPCQRFDFTPSRNNSVVSG